jgi:hypothetical protein
VKICDLGLCKRIEGGNASTVRGTPGFVAPEMIGSYEDTKSSDPLAGDMWCLGETVFRMLTGQPTFDSILSLINYKKGLKHHPIESLNDVIISKQAIDFVKSIMAPNPTNRLTATEADQHSWIKRTSLLQEHYEISSFGVEYDVSPFDHLNTGTLTEPSGVWTVPFKTEDDIMGIKQPHTDATSNDVLSVKSRNFISSTDSQPLTMNLSSWKEGSAGGPIDHSVVEQPLNQSRVSSGIGYMKGSAVPTVERDVLNAFKAFEATERLRAQELQKAAVKRDTAIKLNDLKAFSKKFVLHTPVPDDIIPLLSKDTAKQTQIQEEAERIRRTMKIAPLPIKSHPQGETRKRHAKDWTSVHKAGSWDRFEGDDYDKKFIWLCPVPSCPSSHPRAGIKRRPTMVNHLQNVHGYEMPAVITSEQNKAFEKLRVALK